MNYELFRELRDAGFPQTGRGEFVPKEGADFLQSEARAYVPTLEELIEACGSNFGSLHRIGENDWTAEITSLDVGNAPQYDGSSRIEAVARLWLALNKKV